MKLPFVFAPARVRLYHLRNDFGLWTSLAFGPAALLVHIDLVHFGDVSVRGILCRKISYGLGGIISGPHGVYAGCEAIRLFQFSVFGVFRWP
jgi:hypothetical protein